MWFLDWYLCPSAPQPDAVNTKSTHCSGNVPPAPSLGPGLQEVLNKYLSNRLIRVILSMSPFFPSPTPCIRTDYKMKVKKKKTKNLFFTTLGTVCLLTQVKMQGS